MNGPVTTYNLGAPMTWLEFTYLPADIRKTYLESLVEKYGVSAKQVAQMFGVTPSTLSRNAHLFPGFNFRVRKRQDKRQRDAWERFLGKSQPHEYTEPPVEEKPAETEAAAPVAEPAQDKPMPYEFTVYFYCDGLNSASQAVTALQSVCGVKVTDLHMNWHLQKKENSPFDPF